MKILIVGGAGYIGSHMVKMLAQSGHEVVVLDNLSTGFQKAVKYGDFIKGDLADVELLEGLFHCNHFDGVMHFAAKSLVQESMQFPSIYYRNNVFNTINLLDVMIRHEIKSFIFSSTASIFGEPEYIPIDETHPQKPINVYGSSKQMLEQILHDYFQAYGLNSICLRYFNACGADPEGELGENHDPETHLIPLFLQTASGRRKSVLVFGRDYPTEDGTCVRDYIHVNDLCSAHILALNGILSGEQKGSLAFNLGSSRGFSVQQVIDVMKKVVAKDKRNLVIETGSKRTGDPTILIANPEKAVKILGWKPRYTNLEVIVQQAWNWEKRLAGIKT